MVKIRGYKLVVIVLLILLSVSCFLSLIVKAHISFKNKSDDNTNSIYVNGIGYTIPYTADNTDINNLMSNYFQSLRYSEGTIENLYLDLEQHNQMFYNT